MYFRRTRNTLNTSMSSTVTNSDKNENKSEVSALRKEI